MKIPVYLSVILFLLVSCKHDEKKQALTTLVAQWQGKEVLFPDSLVFTRYATDTVDYSIHASDYKVTLSDLALENVEALAQDVIDVEDSGDGPRYIYYARYYYVCGDISVPLCYNCGGTGFVPC
jgi:hypothetical protein